MTDWDNTAPAEPVPADELPVIQDNSLAKITTFLDEKVDAMAALMMRGIDPEQFLEVAKTLILSDTKLRQCVPLTLYSSLRQAAALGLSVDRNAGEFWLIPRRNWRMSRDAGTDVYECTPMIGYKGFHTLAHRTGLVEHLLTNVVYRDEVERGLIEIEKAPGRIVHKEAFTEIDRSDDAIVGAYCALWLRGAPHPSVEYIDRPEIEKRMKASATKVESGKPWCDWFPAMARKSASRALFGRGYLPLTAKVTDPDDPATRPLTLADAMSMDDAAGDDRQRLALEDRKGADDDGSIGTRRLRRKIGARLDKASPVAVGVCGICGAKQQLDLMANRVGGIVCTDCVEKDPAPEPEPEPSAAEDQGHAQPDEDPLAGLLSQLVDTAPPGADGVLPDTDAVWAWLKWETHWAFPSVSPALDEAIPDEILDEVIPLLKAGKRIADVGFRKKDEKVKEAARLMRSIGRPNMGDLEHVAHAAGLAIDWKGFPTTAPAALVGKLLDAVRAEVRAQA